MAWGKAHGWKNAQVARELNVSTQRMNGWRIRGQVSADYSDDVLRVMRAKPAAIPGKGKPLRADDPLVAVKELTKDQAELQRAMALALRTLTDQQAAALTRMIYTFAGENAIKATTGPIEE